jgi:hypothetical protein
MTRSQRCSTQRIPLKKSGALVRQRTIPTERPPLVGEVFTFQWGGTKSTRYCGHFWPIPPVLRLSTR